MNWADLVIGNASGAAVIALLVCGLGARLRRPAALHALWGLVLLKLVSVPILQWEALPAPERVRSALSGSAPPPAASPVREGERTAALAVEPESMDELAAAAPVRRADARLSELRPAADPPETILALLLPAGALLGASILVGLGSLHAVRFGRLLRTAAPAPPELQGRAEKLSRIFGLSRAPRLRLVPGCVPPSVWPRPGGCEILLPADLLPLLEANERDLLIAHELAHVRRRDHWLRPLELAVVALWWWYPVAWWARRRFRAAEETACDALVVSRFPHAARAYADGLLKTVEFLAHKPSQPVPALATGAARANLRERVTMILDKKPRSPFPRRLVPVVVAAGLLAMLVSPGWLDSSAAVADQDTEAEMEREHAARMLELERQSLEIEQARHRLEMERWEVELRHQEEFLTQELAGLRAEIERLRSEGLVAEAENRERELASREREAILRRKWLEFEREHATEVAAVEMEQRKLELEQQEAVLRGARGPENERQERLLELQRKMKTLEVRRLKAELEQLREVIQMRELELEVERGES